MAKEGKYLFIENGELTEMCKENCLRIKFTKRKPISIIDLEPVFEYNDYPPESNRTLMNHLEEESRQFLEGKLNDADGALIVRIHPEIEFGGHGISRFDADLLPFRLVKSFRLKCILRKINLFI